MELYKITWFNCDNEIMCTYETEHQHYLKLELFNMLSSRNIVLCPGDVFVISSNETMKG